MDGIIQSLCPRMSISLRLLRAVLVTNIRPCSSKPMPIGSETSFSGAHRLSSRPGASWTDTASRPSFARRAAESGENLTTTGENGAAGSATSARTVAGGGAGADTGATVQALRPDRRQTDATLIHACVGVRPAVRRHDIFDTARVKVERG